jgi:lactate dehydrogenase-like 2-hydroxyacid dehydrogenase
VTRVGSSAKAELRRSTTVARAVEALGFDGMKKTLSIISGGRIGFQVMMATL